MIINSASLSSIFIGFKTTYNEGFEGAMTHYRDIAMVVPSTTAEEQYGWLGQFPKVREWVGPRVHRNLVAHGFTIKNRIFEETVTIPRPSLEDDRVGVFVPAFTEMGKVTAEHPDELVFELLKAGFTTPCYDGQNFFDAEHPVGSNDGDTVSVSNMQAGAETPWFLLDTSRAMKPLIYQNRIPFKLTSLTEENDENVFRHDEYTYGVRGRSNVGFGLWQMAYASKAELNAANFEAARVTMATLRGDEGRLLGIKPTTLVVPPSLEGAALRLMNNGTRVELVDNGSGTITPVAVQNEWAGAAKVISAAWLA